MVVEHFPANFKRFYKDTLTEAHELELIETVPLPPGKGSKIIYKRAHPYGAPLLIVRGGGTKVALPWFRTVKQSAFDPKRPPYRMFSWDNQLFGWTTYMLGDEVQQLMDKFREAGYIVLKKDEL